MATILDTDMLENKDLKHKLCPLLGEPRKDCYCTNMNSNKIPLALRFCGEEFEKCRIYQAIIDDEFSQTGKCTPE